MRKASSLSQSIQSYSSSTNSQFCSEPLFEGCSFTHNHRPTLSDTTTKFISCTFSGLTSTADGGAISCTGSNKHLLIKKCTLTSCVSSSGFGGGIYAASISLFLVETTCFVSCNSINKDGGGVYFSSGICFPLLSETSFISCSAQTFFSDTDGVDDGGGVCISCSFPSSQLHHIIKSCRFISCRCYDYGGGGYIITSSSIIGCTDSVFSSCTGDRAYSLGINHGATNADCLIHFCYFYGTTDTNSKTDICINYYTNTFSTPLLHSFSTKNPSKSVRTCVKWNNYQYRNWLP